MREMTDAEKAFFDRTLSQHGLTTDDNENNKKVATPPKRKNKKKPWQKVSNWALALLLVPLSITFLLFYGFMRVEGIIGDGSLSLLAGNPLSETFAEQANAQGMAWLPQLVAVYENKNIIIGGLFTVTIIAIGVILVIEHVITKGRKK